MPTQKKGGFWSTAFHYYYCDDCGEWYYTNTEAEECELKHMKLPFDDSKLAKIIDEKDVQGIISFISYVTNELKDSSSAAFSNSVFSNFISQSLDMLVDTLGIIHTVGDNRAVEPLLELLELQEKLQVSSEDKIVTTLGIIGDDRAVPLLIQIIESSSFDSFWLARSEVGAVEALGKIGDSRALYPIMNIFIKLDKEKTSMLGWRESTYKIVANALKEIPGVDAEFERLEAYEKAEEWYLFHNRHEEAANMRKKKADLAAPKTEIHGDYVDDRDTIVKDSVINRSNVGSGSSKMQELEKLTEMKEKGLIDDDEFKQMKKEILGK